jgi:hypothetical protein
VVVPKKRITSLATFTEADTPIMLELIEVLKSLAACVNIGAPVTPRILHALAPSIAHSLAFIRTRVFSMPLRPGIPGIATAKPLLGIGSGNNFIASRASKQLALPAIFQDLLPGHISE